MATKLANGLIRLEIVRLSFPHMWKPQDGMDGGTPKFSANFLFPPGSSEEQLLKAEMARVAKEKFGDNWANIVKAMEPSKKCLRNGDNALDKGGNIYDGFAGMMYLVAKNAKKPTIVGRNGQPLTEDSGKPYAGCYVNATVEVYAMKAKGKISNNISCTLNAIQFVKDGEAFGAGPTSAEGLDVLDDEEALNEGALGGASDDPFAD